MGLAAQVDSAEEAVDLAAEEAVDLAAARVAVDSVAARASADEEAPAGRRAARCAPRPG